MEISQEWTSLIKYFPVHWHEILRMYDCMEVRVRVCRPTQLITVKNEVMTSLFATEQDINHLVSAFSGSSLYAYEEELRQGFITLAGGHRVGFAGKALLEGRHVRGIKQISSLCIRIARSHPGCASTLLSKLFVGGEIPHILIVSPPQAGKTTLLRDLARQISTGVELPPIRPKRVCIVDERSELAGCYQGRPQLDVGPRTDVLDGYPKAEGMLAALRSLSPEVLITDEIGTIADAKALEEVINCGVKVIASAHGNSYEEVLKRPAMVEFLSTNPFGRVIVLSNRQGPGTIEQIKMVTENAHAYIS